MMLVIMFEQIFLLYFDAGGRSLLIGDHLENCWLATSNSCNICSTLILEGLKPYLKSKLKNSRMICHVTLMNGHLVKMRRKLTLLRQKIGATLLT